MARKSQEVVAEICLYGNSKPEVGAGYLAVLPDKRMFGTGDPVSCRGFTTAVWLALTDIRTAGVTKGVARVFAPGVGEIAVGSARGCAVRLVGDSVAAQHALLGFVDAMPVSFGHVGFHGARPWKALTRSGDRLDRPGAVDLNVMAPRRVRFPDERGHDRSCRSCRNAPRRRR